MTTNNWLWKQGQKLRMNIERNEGANSAFMNTAILSIKACGFTGIRNFIPFSTVNDFGLGKTPPSDAAIKPYFDAVEMSLDAGIQSYQLDFCDVLNNPDLSGAGWAFIVEHVANCSRIAAARGFPKTRVSYGGVNEYAAQTDKVIVPLMGQLALAMQATLGVDQPIVINGCNWGYIDQEVESDFVVPSGLLCPIVQCHDYDLQALSGWNGVASKAAALEARLGCPVIIGEVGLDGQSGSFNLNVYEGTIQSLMGAVAEYLPTPWADTAGSADRMNISASDGTINPQLVGPFTWANSQIKGATIPGGSVTPPAPVPPVSPAPVVTPPVVTPPVATTPTFTISAPGTVTSSASPVMVQQTVAGPSGTAFQWIVASDQAPNFPWYGDLTPATVGSSGTLTLSVPYNQTGDFLKVMSPAGSTPSWDFDGLPIMINTPTVTPPAPPAPAPIPPSYTFQQLEVDVLTILSESASTNWATPIAAAITKYQAANPGK